MGMCVCDGEKVVKHNTVHTPPEVQTVPVLSAPL